MILGAHIADVGDVPIYLHHCGAIILVIILCAIILAPHRPGK